MQSGSTRQTAGGRGTTSRAALSLVTLLSSPHGCRRRLRYTHPSNPLQGNDDTHAKCSFGSIPGVRVRHLPEGRVEKLSELSARGEGLDDGLLHFKNPRASPTTRQCAFPSAEDETSEERYTRPGGAGTGYPPVLPLQSYTQLYTVLLHLLFEIPGGVKSLDCQVLQAALVLLDTFHPSYVGLIKQNDGQSATRPSVYETLDKGMPVLDNLEWSTSRDRESPPLVCPHRLREDPLSDPLEPSLPPYSSSSPSEVLASPHSPRTSLLHSQILKALRRILQPNRKEKQQCVPKEGGTVPREPEQTGPYILVSEALVMPYVIDIVLRPTRLARERDGEVVQLIPVT